MIRFSDPTGKWAFLSNAFPCNFMLDDRVWSSVEHYYHAKKFLNFAEQEAVRLCPTPVLAIEKGRDVGRSFRQDWSRHRLGAMKDAIAAKFVQRPQLAAQLLETGQAELIYEATFDNYWGAGAENRGENMVGKILMDVRTELRRTGAGKAKDH